MQIQRLIILAAAALACGVHAQRDVSYGFGLEEERATQHDDSVTSLPATAALAVDRRSYVTQSTPTATTAVATPFTTPASTTSGSTPVPTPASTKTGCPSMCTANFKPVCGSDGRTYSNACTLSVAQCKNPSAKITLVTEGECGERPSTPATPSMPVVTPTTSPPAPPATTTPVPSSPSTPSTSSPSSSGATPPSSPKCMRMCTADYKPICGSDGQTYSNACELSVAQCERPQNKIVKVADGECGPSASTGTTDSTSVPTSATPVSSASPSPGGAAASPSPAPGSTPAATTPTMTAKPAPPTQSKCEMACAKMFAPVCGSNGTTYSNACLLRLANCKADATSKVSIQHEGACRVVVATAKPTEAAAGGDTAAPASTSTTATAATGGKGSNLRGSPFQGQ